MKPALLDILVCPACQNALDLRADVRKELEVLEGALRCMGCARDYPIVSGVPRFVGSAAYASSFGRQWHWFRKVQIDSMSGTDESERMLAATTGWSGEDYRGQLVLDAGVGAGRFAEIVSNKGGDVVGVDLSQAIDAAYENIGSRAQCPSRPGRHPRHALPGRDVRHGVLRGGATPHAGTRRRLRPHGRRRAPGRGARGLPLRPLRAEPPILGHDSRAHHAAALPRPPGAERAGGPAYYLYRVPFLGKVLGVVCPISLHRDWRWRWLDTFDWYSPRYQWKLLYPEVVRWFRTNGFRHVELFDGPIRMRGVKTGEPS